MRTFSLFRETSDRTVSDIHPYNNLNDYCGGKPLKKLISLLPYRDIMREQIPYKQKNSRYRSFLRFGCPDSRLPS